MGFSTPFSSINGNVGHYRQQAVEENPDDPHAQLAALIAILERHAREQGSRLTRYLLWRRVPIQEQAA